MVDLAEPVPGELLASQLGPKTRILTFRGVEVHAFAGEEAPDVMREIGRIREKEFRAVGAGRNMPADLDDLDFGAYSYRQLAAWDPERRELVAAYRYILCGDLKDGPGVSHLRTATLFNFSDRLRDEVLPYSVELGRSVVNREAGKAIMGLYCAWAGLGALAREYSHLQYFYGNFCVYSSYPKGGIELILQFLERHHADTASFLSPRSGLGYEYDRNAGNPYSGDYATDYDILISTMARLGTSVPPILLSYLGATRNLVYLGAARDDDFGGVVECAILVPLQTVNQKTRSRFIESYTSVNPDRFRKLRYKETP
jgi:hypothetical protein